MSMVSQSHSARQPRFLSPCSKAALHRAHLAHVSGHAPSRVLKPLYQGSYGLDGPSVQYLSTQFAPSGWQHVSQPVSVGLRQPSVEGSAPALPPAPASSPEPPSPPVATEPPVAPVVPAVASEPPVATEPPTAPVVPAVASEPPVATVPP